MEPLFSDHHPTNKTEVVLKEGCSLGLGTHFDGIMEGTASEKVVLLEGWSLDKGSFTWKYEGERFRKK